MICYKCKYQHLDGWSVHLLNEKHKHTLISRKDFYQNNSSQSLTSILKYVFSKIKKKQVYPYTTFEDNDSCVVFSTVLFKESIWEFKTWDEKPYSVNMFPYSENNCKYKIRNLPEFVETKILNIIKIIDNHKWEYAGVKTYHKCN